MSDDPPTNGHRYLTIPNFCASIGHQLKPRYVEELARRGVLPSVKVGRKRMIRADALDVLHAKQAGG